VSIKKKPKELLAWLFILAVGAAATWQVYHFQFSSHLDLFPGPNGDSRLTAYVVEHWYQTLLGHADLASPAMFYPVKGTLGYSDVFLAYVPGYSLLRFLGINGFLALAVMVIFFCYLNFLSCVVLLKKVFKCGVLASCAGALFFAFNNPKLAQADHLQLQPVFLLPVVAGLLVSFFMKNRNLTEMKAFVMLTSAGVALNVQLLTSFYLGWFFIFGTLLFVALSFAFPSPRALILDTLHFHIKAVTAAAFLFVVGFIPFVLIYWPALRSTGWYGLLPEYIPEFKSFLLMGEGNYIWKAVTNSLLTDGSPDWGRRIGIGLVPSIAWITVSLLSISWLLKDIMPSRSASKAGMVKSPGYDTGRAFLALMILTANVFCILGLQFRGHTLWKLVYFLVPGAKAIRAVARYAIVLALPMAIAFSFMVQYAVREIASRKNVLTRASFGLVLFIVVTFGLVEQLNDGYGMYYSISAENARIDTLAARLPQDCSVFYVAAASSSSEEEFEEQNSMHDAMLVSLKRHVPTLNGRSGKYPSDWSLRNIKATDYEDNIQRWIQQHALRGKVCRLEID
jgi:hypothetical protein